MNDVLRNVLCLIHNNVGAEDAPWMNRIACKYFFCHFYLFVKLPFQSVIVALSILE